LEMGAIGCPETSVTNYRSTLRNVSTRRKIWFISRRKPQITIFIRFQRWDRILAMWIALWHKGQGLITAGNKETRPKIV
jgi:hypothetical protein